MSPLMYRRWMFWAAAALLILNLLDATFTLVYVHAGLASEANPLMDAALSASPVGFVLLKMTLVSLGVGLLWRLRQRRTAGFAMMASAAAYGSLLVYHLSAVPQLVAFAN